MVDKVLRTADRCHMLPTGGSVVVALSGGADSAALLHVLISIKEKYNLTVSAAHLNHMLRGEEAERDEQFCKILCEKYHIPFYVRRRDVRALSAARKISEELCGREERYRFFDELSEKLHARIATAHTASDNAETLLFNLTRGASVAGAAGIPPVRLPYIRPLIACTRAEIECYCGENGLSYVTDSSNLSDDYTRNKIRHHVVPVLRELNPRFEEAALRFCESAANAQAYIEESASDVLSLAREEGGYSAAVLLHAAPAVLNEALAALCREQADFSAEQRHLDLLRRILERGGAVDLGRCAAVCKQGLLRFAADEALPSLTEVPLDSAVSFTYGGRRITASVDNSKNELNDLVFRNRRSGDRFTFGKRGLSKPLRKALNEKKIPSERRDSLVLLCLDGTVLWCEGLGFSRQGEALAASAGLAIQISIIHTEKGRKDA